MPVMADPVPPSAEQQSSPSEGALTYREAGVNIDAAVEALDSSKKAIRATFGPRVLQTWAHLAAFLGLTAWGRNPFW